MEVVEHVKFSNKESIVSLIPTITKGANRKQSKTNAGDYKRSIEIVSQRNPLERGDSGWADLSRRVNYNFDDFSNAEDVDPYFSRTFQLTIEQCIKEGFELVGPDSELVDLIESKLNQICHQSQTNLYELMDNLIAGMARYCNSVAVLVRAEPLPSSPFKSYVHRGKQLNPICGIFQTDPQNMTPHKKSGRIDKWLYSNKKQSYVDKEFKTYNVVHTRWNVKNGETFGTPWTLPALDDIRMLRRLEEFVQMLISKHLFPLLHYRVGTDTIPSLDEENGTSEVALVRAKVQDLPSEGVIVSSHRHEIVAVNQSQSIMEIGSYLEHFDQRARTGCGLSDIDIGKGGTANRNTAQTLNATRVDRCIRIQRKLEADLHDQLILPLLLSLGKDPWAPENQVTFSFRPIDTEEARARDNHEMGIFNVGIGTHDEARRAMRRRPFTEQAEWDNTVGNTVQRIAAEQGAQAAKKQAAAKAAVTSATQPSNQHGESTTKPKQNKDSQETEIDTE